MLRPNFEERCLINAPDAMKSLSKEDILLYMHDAYISQCVEDKNYISIYHGTSNLDFKLNPHYKNPDNDFGSGLYTTPTLDLAKEWAMSFYGKGNSGLAIEFLLNTRDLKVLNLCKHNILHWVAILTYYRPVLDNDLVLDYSRILQSKYYIDLEKFDAVIGYRADDSYFTYVRDFMLGTICLETLEKAMFLGNLGKQICLKSPKAFSRLDEVYRYKCNVKDSQRFINRDKKARDDYRVLRKNNPIRGTYIRDILISEGLC